MKKIVTGLVVAFIFGNAQAADPTLFNEYVALGDSLTQGVQGTSAEETRQPDAYPALLAKAMGTTYTEAPLTFPGNSVNDEDFIKGNVKWWQYYYPLIGGYRKDGYKNQSTLTNYGIAGATISDIIDNQEENTGMQKLVLGKTGESAVNQALAQNPTFVSVWIGHNDVLKAVTRTDTSMMTDTAVFEQNMNRLVAKIKQTPSVKGVVLGNLVDITQLPYLELVNKATFPQGSKRVYLKSDESVNSAADVLDPTELAFIQQRLQEINAVIEKVAKENQWAFVDFHQFYLDAVKNGHLLRDKAGFSTNHRLTTQYLGGFFSLDGLHISTTGQAVFANQFIDAINVRYQANLPLVDEIAVSKTDSLYQNPVDPRQQ